MDKKIRNGLSCLLVIAAGAGCAYSIKIPIKTRESRIEKMVDVDGSINLDRIVDASKTENGSIVYRRIEVDLDNDGIVNFIYVVDKRQGMNSEAIHLYDKTGKEIPYCQENLMPFAKIYADSLAPSSCH